MPSTDHTGGLPSYNYTSSRVAFLMPGLILIQFALPLDFHTGNTFLGIQAVALDNSQTPLERIPEAQTIESKPL